MGLKSPENNHKIQSLSARKKVFLLQKGEPNQAGKHTLRTAQVINKHSL